MDPNDTRIDEVHRAIIIDIETAATCNESACFISPIGTIGDIDRPGIGSITPEPNISYK